MRRRLVRLLLAVAAVVVVTAPLVGARATNAGFELAVVPSLKLGAAVLAIGVAWLLLHEGWTRFAAAPAAGAVDRVARARGAKAVLLVALALLVAALPLFASGKWIGLVLETLVYMTIASGLNIALGMTGLLVLGHAAFWAVGAYTFAMLTVHFQTNFWIAFPAAGAAAALVGLVLGLPALRLRGDYLAIVTLGFGESIRWIIKNNGAVTGGDAGIPGSETPDVSLREPLGALGKFLWQPTDRNGCYYFALALAVLCLASVSLLKRSRVGRAMFALREDETAARCMGINTVKVKLVAFMSAAVWAGLAGVVHPVYRGQVTPELFNFDASVTFVAMVVLGGLGSVAGSAIGAASLWILPALLRDWIPEVQDYRMLVFGAVLAAMMIVRPQGIVGRAATRRPSSAPRAPTAKAVLA
jgi:branched-chain amino acid transport system permease protein